MSKINDLSSQQSWRDRFLQKIFRGISTFSVIPIISHIIAPMITYLLPVAYSIYYLLGIPSNDVMQGRVDFGGENIYEMLIDAFLLGLYFISSGLLLLSIFTMAKEKKKGHFNLIQHGIYAKIRHPQNLAISVLLLSMSILWDTLAFRGFKTGHVISWGVFTLFLQLESLIEEKHLLKKFPDQYWAYIHNTGFFHFRLGKQKSIPPKLPESESKYFRKRIILSVGGFIIFYLMIFSVVKILKNNSADFLLFYDPFLPITSMYPDTHIINEIVVVLVPIGIWLVSFILTLVHYLKEESNKNKSASYETGEKKSLISTKLDSFLFWVFLIFLILVGFLNIAIFANYLNRMFG